MKKILYVGFIFLTFGCAKDYYVNFQNEKDFSTETGTLVIELTKPMRNVNVVIGDKIVAKEKYTEKIVVRNISSGSHEVSVLGQENDRDNLKETFTVNIGSGEKTEKLLQTPSLSGWWYVKTGLIIAVTTTVTLLLTPSQY